MQRSLTDFLNELQTFIKPHLDNSRGIENLPPILEPQPNENASIPTFKNTFEDLYTSKETLNQIHDILSNKEINKPTDHMFCIEVSLTREEITKIQTIDPTLLVKEKKKTDGETYCRIEKGLQINQNTSFLFTDLTDAFDIIELENPIELLMNLLEQEKVIYYNDNPNQRTTPYDTTEKGHIILRKVMSKQIKDDILSEGDILNEGDDLNEGDNPIFLDQDHRQTVKSFCTKYGGEDTHPEQINTANNIERHEDPATHTDPFNASNDELHSGENNQQTTKNPLSRFFKWVFSFFNR